MMIRPLADRVLVKPLEEDEKTPSGLVLPETAKEKPQKGKVLVVGPGRTEDGKVIPIAVKKGDVVLYAKYGPSELKDGSDELLLVREEDILAVIE
jgi:chaperonin GroES